MAAHPIGFFGLKLVPGEVQRLDVTRDFRLTNVSFADEVKAGTRALVKVHYTMPPEFDSDDEDEDEDEEKPIEDPEEKTYTLCTLVAGKTEQAVVDLQFCEEEEVGFSITGSAAVDLVGNYVAPPDFYDQDPDSDEFDSEDEYDSDIYGDVDMDDDDDEEAEDAEDRIQEIIETPAKKTAAAKKAIEAAPASASKKRAAEEEPVTKNQKKKLEKKEQQAAASPAKSEKEKASPAKKAEEKKPEQKKAAETLKKTTTASGLIIEEKKTGTGPQAKAGQKVGMRYVGKLTNGKIFDQCIKGKPFSFKLGRGEVIKGWDEGVKGMQVGSERRLTCPPKLAYGNQKIPGIPPNSTLVFDVKLVEIK